MRDSHDLLVELMEGGIVQPGECRLLAWIRDIAEDKQVTRELSEKS